VHDDVGVIGWADGGEVELLGGAVAVVEAPLDFGDGAVHRLVSGPGAIQCLLERDGHEDAQVPPINQPGRRRNTPSKSSMALAGAVVIGWDSEVSVPRS
jgi:hypothetical protein